MPKSIIITGANGYLGRDLLKKLEDAGDSITILGRHRPAIFHGNFIEFDLVTDDINEVDFKKLKCTQLIHLAWYMKHGDFWNSEQNEIWRIKSEALFRKFTQSGGSHIVCAGSCAEYAWNNEVHHENEIPIIPSSLYGQSKNALRIYLNKLSNHYDLTYSWARIFFVYGENQESTKLIPSLISACKEETPTFFLADAENEIDFIHKDDVVSGLYELSKQEASGEFNLSCFEGIKINELAQTICLKYGADIRDFLQNSQVIKTEASKIIGSNSNLRDLGWNPNHNLLDWITQNDM